MSVAHAIAPVLRADAARNRARVLEAASRMFAEHGIDVSMQQVADAAGVGIGTVFRRFRTKDELVLAVLHERLEEVVALADHAQERAHDEPWDAFASFFVAATELHVRHRGFMETVASVHAAQPALDEVRTRLLDALRALVGRAIDAGELRSDITAEDIPIIQCAISRTSCMPITAAEPDAWRRPVALLLDGMRATAARTPLAPALPTFEQVLGELR